MKTMLRNLARQWAIKALVKHNDDLRRKLISAEARIERQEQTMRQGARALDLATAELDEATSVAKDLHAELDRKEDQIQRQANLFEQVREQAARERESLRERMGQQITWLAAERAEALQRVAQLEQTIVAMSAAQEAPEDKHRCPEGLLVDGVELHHCIRTGGHDGNHWNRGHEREWAPLPEVDNIEVPW